MKQLLNVSFDSEKLPDDWIEEKGNFSFRNGALFSSWATICKFVLTGKGWKKLKVEIELEMVNGALVTCGDNISTIIVDLTKGRHRIICSTQTLLKENLKPIDRKNGKILVTFESDNGILRGTVDGSVVIEGNDPRYHCFFGLMELGFWDDCLIYRVRISGDEELEKSFYMYPAKQNKEFSLSVCVDFVDDIVPVPYTKEMFEQLFSEFESWGVKRCYWIYYGGLKSNFWDTCVYNIGKHLQQTVENVGEPFQYAVNIAHNHNIEIFGLIKPFDMGHGWYSFPDTPEGAKRGKLKRIGGYIDWVADFPAKNRRFIISRKPGTNGPKDKKITRIDLVKEDSKSPDFTVHDVEILISDDNAHYYPYSAKIERQEVIENYPLWEHTPSGGRPTGEKRKCFVMRFNNLDIQTRYFALRVKSRSASFSNTLINLIHVFGENGEERCLTYGVLPRANFIAYENWGTFKREDFTENGVEFDLFDIQGATSPGFEAISAIHTFDAGYGFLAIARGKNDGPVSVLSPSFFEVRQWWLSLIRDVLVAGADGVELRMRNHNKVCAWSEFGFEEPIRNEFLNRYGIDIWKTDDFDRVALRRLRGEFYTQFYREAKKLVRSYGKKLGLHISITMDVEPEIGAPMDIHFDWRSWLKENIADCITMKEVWPKTRFAEEILSFTRERGIPVIFSPYANNIWRQGKGVEICEKRIRFAKENGFDGFQYYESASVLRATRDGKLIMLQPGLGELFKKYFKTY